MSLVRATMVVVALAFISSAADDFAEADRRQCRRQLLLLRDALDRYRERHNDWPDSLAELLPEYVADRSLFDCPRAVRSGIITKENVGRSRLAIGSYFYEFTLEPKATVAGVKRTQREWKERQMSLVGDSVPVLRCQAHERDRVLNLPVRGPIYESGRDWEQNFTNNVLTSSSLDDDALFAAEATVRTSLAPRDLKATPAHIDLAVYYNLRIADPLIARLGLVPGFLATPEVQFDLRGAIQLRFAGTNGQHFPRNVIAVPINATCRRLHFLHSIAAPLEPDTIVARYVIRDARGRLHPMPIAYGRNIVAATASAEAPKGLAQTRVIEIANDSKRAPALLCISSWTNPSPDLPIASVDLRSAVAQAAPFVLAITVE